MIALIVHSCYRFAKLGMYDWLQWVIAAGCCLTTIWSEAEVAVLFKGVSTLGILYTGRRFRCAPAPRWTSAPQRRRPYPR